MKKSKKGIVKPNDDTFRNKDDLCNKTKIKVDKKFINYTKILAYFLIPFFCYVLYKYFQVDNQLIIFKNNEYIFSKDIDDKKWGSFRSGHYFGLKTLAQKSMVFGLMWFKNQIVHNYVDVRHWCEHSDNLKSYGWLKHDFDSFGLQKIIDDKFNITTSFLIGKNSNWTAQINVDLIDKIKEHDTKVNIKVENILSFVPYFALDSLNDAEEELYFDEVNSRENKIFIKGKTSIFKNGFIAKIDLKYQNSLVYLANLSESLYPPLLNIKDKLIENLFVTSFPGKEYDRTKYLILLQNKNLLNRKKDKDFINTNKTNLFLQQIAITVPAKIEISFFENTSPQESNLNYVHELNERINNYDKIFKEIFKLEEKNFTEEEINFGKSILSNMIGSIGSFYGYSMVTLDEPKKNRDTSDLEHTKVTKRIVHKYGPFKLLTSVPSRSFFPRGFLWDEGFHQLLIYKYNLNLSKTIIKSWFNLINRNGWIPREVILGVEAEARVPKEFIVQNFHNANPPTFFLTLDSILNMLLRNNKFILNKNKFEENKIYFKELFPKLCIWYNYFNTTQVGYRFGTFKWKGRDSNKLTELNVKTLTSGLDDYPRASSPTDNEIHVDLYSWMLFSTKIMFKIANFINDPSKIKYQTFYELLLKNDILNKIHWSEKDGMFCDFGLHSKNVTLVRILHYKPKIRKELEQPKYRCINEFGYVSLFPFLLQLIEPNDSRLNIILDKLVDRNLLWTNYGLRSLSTTSNYYQKYNTENDPPYWRGAIWININFLVLRSLNYYSLLDGPYQNKLKNIYVKLKNNLVLNLFKQYKKSGYIWESYDDIDGHGKGTHPFTGWSSLILLIMADNYN